jgi:hypothetical protein
MPSPKPLLKQLPFVILCLLLSAGCFLTTAYAQSATATLSGTVEDEKKAVVPGANVTVMNTATGLQRQTTTNGEGYFVVPLLFPSTYQLRVECTGFALVDIQNVVLNVGDQKVLNITLKVAQVGANVDVKSEAPLINESPAVATVVDRQFVGNLPLNGRSFQSLISLTPGFVVTPASNANSPGQFSINGQRTDTNYFTVDGVSANIGVNTSINNSQGFAGAQPGLAVTGGTNNLVSVDALQEFKVQTSTFAPEFGRSPGAQVEIATRSGTNAFHGALFDYLRNDVFDANDWFANANRLRKPPLRQNNFGGVIGGPILLPRFGEGGDQPGYHGRDRTFFFFSYEGLRLRQPQVANTAVPSLTTRSQTAAGIQPLIKALPLPTGVDLTNPTTGQPTGWAQFAASYSDAIRLDATSIRIDHAVSNKLTFFGRYNHAPSSSLSRGSGAISTNSLTSTIATTKTLTLGSTLLITPTVINQLRANYSVATSDLDRTLDGFGGAIPTPDVLLFPAFTSRDFASVFAQFNFNGNLMTFNVGRTANNSQRQLNIVDTVSIVKGSHQLKFGADYRRLTPTIASSEYGLTLTFSSLANIIAGRASTVSTSSRERLQPIYNNLSLFGQDTWKVRRQLSLTYGVRWEYNPPPHEASGKEALTLTGLDNPATFALAPRGTPFYETPLDGFAPRFGVAYELSQSRGRETVIRGGVGVFYDLGSNQAGLGYSSFPFSGSRSQSNLPFPLTAEQLAAPPFPTNFNPPFSASFLVYDENFRLPYTIQGNLAIEQSLGANQTLSATYVSALGRRLLLSDTRSRPNPNFTNVVTVIRNNGTSDYHALQLQFHRRLSRGLQALASYTWSHAIDAISDAIQFTPERGSADFDVRHAFSAALTYNIPELESGALARAFLNDWSVDTIVRYQSATPVNLSAGIFAILPDGSNLVVRPDLVAGVPLYIDDPRVPGGKRFNPAAFVRPATGRQGTLGRNVVRGFPSSQVDMALRRQFNLGEQLKLQFRAEAFNIFNHPNFGIFTGSSNANITSGQFGRATQMLGRSLGGLNPLYQVGGPRSLQFALKLVF